MIKVPGAKETSDMLAKFVPGNYKIKVCIVLKRRLSKKLKLIEIDYQYDADVDSWMSEITNKVSENGLRPLWMYSIQEIFVGLKAKKRSEEDEDYYDYHDCECAGIWAVCSGEPNFQGVIVYGHRKIIAPTGILKQPPQFVGPTTDKNVFSASGITEIARDRGGCLCRFEMRN